MWRRLICRLLGQHKDPGGEGIVRCARCDVLFDVSEQRDVAVDAQAW